MPVIEPFRFPHFIKDANDDLRLEINKQIKDNYLSTIDWNMINLNQSNWNKNIDSAYTTLGSDINYLIDYYSLSKLKSFILLHAKEYLDFCEWTYDGIKIGFSWSTLAIKGSVQGHHNHGYGAASGQISGVYYVSSTPSQDAGMLNLQSPYHPKQQNVFPFGNKCIPSASFTAQPGRLIMFPAWTEHWVSPIYIENYTRITIAFNVTASNGWPSKKNPDKAS